MGQPAARVTDNHTCPQHGGGPVIPPGCPTVIIGGQAAARVGDQLQCGGAIDIIKSGSSTVTIGGKQAARKGDATEHGGVIVQGESTVLIGG